MCQKHMPPKPPYPLTTAKSPLTQLRAELKSETLAFGSRSAEKPPEIPLRQPHRKLLKKGPKAATVRAIKATVQWLIK